MKERENYIKAYRFQSPEIIPMAFKINAASWPHYGRELEKLVVDNEFLFPGYIEGSVDWNNFPFNPAHIAGQPYTDRWGCVWETHVNGIAGTVIHHPLSDWADLDSYEPPDPDKNERGDTIDWKRRAAAVKKRKGEGRIAISGIEHGFLFLRLSYLRGFENVLYDMADGSPELATLIGEIEDYNKRIVENHLDSGADIVAFPEDLGAQQTPLISPEMFRTYLQPVYTRLMATANKKGVLVHMHSDGHIFDLLDDILACGVDIINLQDLVHGVDEIARHLKGRVAIELDVDRQRVTRFGSPGDIDDLIREEVAKLGSPEGGLSLKYGLYPGTPIENARAVMDAMTKYANYFA